MSERAFVRVCACVRACVCVCFGSDEEDIESSVLVVHSF